MLGHCVPPSSFNILSPEVFQIENPGKTSRSLQKPWTASQSDRAWLSVGQLGERESGGKKSLARGVVLLTVVRSVA